MWNLIDSVQILIPRQTASFQLITPQKSKRYENFHTLAKSNKNTLAKSIENTEKISKVIK